MTNSGLYERACKFAESTGTAVEKQLGFGSDGAVWQTARKTAIKVFERPEVYAKELAVYERFRQRQFRDLAGFAIPLLARFQDDLLVIEMSIVEPPYILDFGKVYLDKPPDFSPEVMADFFEKQEELWGRYWPAILKLWTLLRANGIYHMDPKPGNIMPENYDPTIDDDEGHT